MSKKGKKILALAEDLKVMITFVPKLEAFIKVHEEIAAGYQKYRKNGGAAISGIEKHMGIKEPKGATVSKIKGTAKIKAPKESTKAIKTKKSAAIKNIK